MEPINTPVFIHIGLGKAASSLLQVWFAKQEDIYLINTKDLVDYGWSTTPGSRKAFVLSDERFSVGLKFDALTASVYTDKDVAAYQHDVCSALHHIFPTGRILLITRGFEEIIYSYYSQYVKKAGTFDFEMYLETYGALVQESLNLDRLIGFYETAFGGDRLTILPMELLRDDPAHFFDQLTAAFNIPARQPPKQTVNPALDRYAIQVYPKFSRAAAHVAGWLPQRLRRRFMKFYTGPIIRSPLTEKLAEWLVRLGIVKDKPLPPIPADYLASFNSKASKLAGRPLYEKYAAAYRLDASDTAKAA